MPKRMEIYKCEICGNIVELTHGGAGQLVCCGQPMKQMEAQTAEMATEKHVPVIEKTEAGYRVTVGSTIHPMIDKHYIEWIELVSGEGIHRQYLKPGMDPIVEFRTGDLGEVSAREYCNIHGLWRD
ncbi:MAG: desulfoferrodoxin [Candidatus Fermentibacteraceae bacterium]|nr:desulfoferrodoxin [Candidatus Fermentibacteraceae bacterium]MBN2608857.1 desulfoferrodoxin [Candidatus Fermentibacteraceae bacterium]